jgi:hypothetical protein
LEVIVLMFICNHLETEIRGISPHKFSRYYLGTPL